MSASVLAGAAGVGAWHQLRGAAPAAAQPPSDNWTSPQPGPSVVVAEEQGSFAPGEDPVSGLQDIIDSASAERGGVDVSLSAAGDYPWASTLRLPSNTRLFLGGGVRLVADGLESMIETAAGAQNCAIVGGTLDANDEVSGSVVLVADGFDRLRFSTRIVNSGAPSSSRTLGIRLGQGTRVEFVGCDFEELFLAVRVDQPVTNVVMRECHASQMASQGNLIQLFGEVNRVWIADNVCTGQKLDAVGGHFIQTSGEARGNDHRNVFITGNYFIGPDVAFSDLGGEAEANGGSGDMIACRGIDGFVVANNILRQTGEFGITAIHGSRNGVITGNIITDADASAIVVGSPEFRTVHNINVHHNTIVRSGLDRADELGRVARAGVRFWNAANCAFSDNLLEGFERNGLYIHSPPVGEDPTVTEFHHLNNRYIPGPNSEAPIWDNDRENGGEGEPNWTEALVI